MDIYKILEKLNIKYTEVDHEKVYTIEQAQKIKTMIDGTGCKNLFLTDNKDKFILVILEESKKANIKEIEKISNTKHLSFASENNLTNILKLESGSVTPLGIINDVDNKVLILIDKYLKNKKLLVHPNTNNKTMSIEYDDLIKFIEYEKHKYILM